MVSTDLWSQIVDRDEEDVHPHGGHRQHACQTDYQAIKGRLSRLHVVSLWFRFGFLFT